MYFSVSGQVVILIGQPKEQCKRIQSTIWWILSKQE